VKNLEDFVSGIVSTKSRKSSMITSKYNLRERKGNAKPSKNDDQNEDQNLVQE
jgi:hypothetical protein